ncbi:hypothetical protein [Novosphingobium sp. ST904]
MIQLDFGFGALEAEFWRLVFVMTRIARRWSPRRCSVSPGCRRKYG